MKAADVYAATTAAIVAQLEQGANSADWKLPWNGAHGVPSNASTGAAYKGGNVLLLWSVELEHQFPTSVWATYKQWVELGAQVRKGETATHCVKWVVPSKKDAETGERVQTSRGLVPFGFAVFNAAQVDGWAAPATGRTGPDPIPHCEAFFAAIGARIVPGEPAFSPGSDVIMMPVLEAFKDAVAYYATLSHEHIHWTGHSSRLARAMSTKFGSDAYAAEELVAELGAAFVAAHLGIETSPREDHAQYLHSWIRCLKSDPKHLFQLASTAQKATEYLLERAGEQKAQKAA